LIAFVKIGSLILDIYLYARPADNFVAAPIRNAVAAFPARSGDSFAGKKRI
jgi:hypothetical protein